MESNRMALVEDTPSLPSCDGRLKRSERSANSSASHVNLEPSSLPDLDAPQDTPNKLPLERLLVLFTFRSCWLGAKFNRESIRELSMCLLFGIDSCKDTPPPLSPSAVTHVDFM